MLAACVSTTLSTGCRCCLVSTHVRAASSRTYYYTVYYYYTLSKSVFILLLYKQNWLHFLFVLQATALKQQMSKKISPHIICTEASYHIFTSQWPVINVNVAMRASVAVCTMSLCSFTYNNMSSLCNESQYYSVYCVSL